MGWSSGGHVDGPDLVLMNGSPGLPAGTDWRRIPFASH